MTTTDDPPIRTVGDGQGRTLEYVVRPAMDPPNAPTIVVFHGAAANQQPSKLASPSWNVIAPLDRTGDDGEGSDWVGRSDDPFVVDLVCRAIGDARASFGGDRGLYTWGTSIGGFGALLYGILCDATAVRCMLPTVRLWGVPYRKSRREERNLIRSGAGKGPYDDLVELVRSGAPWRMPFISIVENRWDGERFHEEHALDLVAACAERGVGFHLEVLPQSGHFPLEAAHQGMAFFEQYQENIARYRYTPHPAATTPQRFAHSRAAWGQARNESVERGRAFADLGLGLELASSGGPWPEGSAGPGLKLVESWATSTSQHSFLDDLVAAHRADGDDRFLDVAGLVIHEWSMRFLEQDRLPFACSPLEVPSVAARIHIWARFVTYAVQAAPAWAAANPRLLERVVSSIRSQGIAVATTNPARLGSTRRKTRENLLDQLALALADDPPLLDLAVAGDANQVDNRPATDQRTDVVDAPREPTGRTGAVEPSPANPSSPQLSATAAIVTRLGEPALLAIARDRLAQLASDPGRIERARAWLDEGLLTFSGFAPTPLSVPIDWNANPFHYRSWVFDLHRLRMIPDLLAMHVATGDPRALDRAVSVAVDWLTTFPTDRRDGTPEMAWHDHATCLRAEVLLALLGAVVARDPAMVKRQPEAIEQLVAGLRAHAALLANPAFEQRRHNHAWDQARALWLLSDLFAGEPPATAWRNRAGQRLREETHHMLAADGTHIENSPAYALRACYRWAGLYRSAVTPPPLDDLAPRMQQCALTLAAMIQPDGRFPHLGDTDDVVAPPTLPVSLEPAAAAAWQWAATFGGAGAPPPWTSLVLADGGYAVLRNHWPRGRNDSTAIHVVVKAGPRSTAHLHDDDGHLVAWALGEPWLIDSGMYAYEETAPERIHVRSRAAHNVLATTPAPPLPRRLDAASPFWRVTASSADAGTPFVTIESRRDPGVIRARTVTLSGNDLLVRDEATLRHDGLVGMSLRWHVPGDHRVDIADNRVVVTSPAGNRMLMNFRGPAPENIAVETGVSGDRIGAIRSQRKRSWEPATVIVVDYGRRRELQVITTIIFTTGP